MDNFKSYIELNEIFVSPSIVARMKMKTMYHNVYN